MPYLVKLSPAGDNCLVDLNNAGALSAVVKRLDNLGLTDTPAKTVDGIWADCFAKAEIMGEEIIRVKEIAYSQTGGLIAYVEAGNQVSIDIPAHKIELLTSKEEIAARKAEKVPRPPKQVSGCLKCYHTMGTSANRGVILDDSKF